MEKQKPETLESIIERRLSRRAFLSGSAKAVVGAYVAGKLTYNAAFAEEEMLGAAGYVFEELPHAKTETLQVPEGYIAQVLVRWGDAVLPGAPEFDARSQSSAAQKMQYGYNNDYIAFMPLPYGSGNSDYGLLCVNHESTDAYLMFSGLTRRSTPMKVTKEQAQVELAAHGHSVIEVQLEGGAWQIIEGGQYNRRFNALDTELELTGPAAGHDRLKTSEDPTGRKVTGTLGNCSGGITPWGTVLLCEENIDLYFGGLTDSNPEAVSHQRFGFRDNLYSFSRHFSRFDMAQEPNEAHRFGWVVEYDPYNPESKPVKRTALGRFKHEAANTALAVDGRVVVYMADDDYFEHLYKFVSRNPYNPESRMDNMNLLDEGTLYAAKLSDDGSLEWMPLVFGEGELNDKKKFFSQADVLIEARRAADLHGATQMDRPEDFEPNPVNGKVYVALSKNKKRDFIATANPRAKNLHGHILELSPPMVDGKPDHGALKYTWDVFILAGDPAKKAQGAKYNEGVSQHGWFSNPDNITFDNKGNMWLATDGMEEADGFSDGLYVIATTGDAKALPRHFLNAPTGAEVTGPAFTPDCSTLFISIMHPGKQDTATFDNPPTRWPDFDAGPPRPSLVAIRREDGGELA